MTDFTNLRNHVLKRVELSEEDVNVFCSFFKQSKIKKRQFIIQPEFVAKYRNYIVQGAFRAYVVADEGQEHTIQFAIEDWWISDYNSYIYQQPNSEIKELPKKVELVQLFCLNWFAFIS
ncbi:MAG: hypothetical protein MUC49_00330 [Raineya sp.]|jgi:hypothetical protein|nr:hypothetical protein [Raineya sp.]